MNDLLKMVAVLIAALIIGNWFLNEFKKAHAAGKPWYSAYLTLPGLLICLAFLLPLLAWVLKQ